MDSVLDSLAVHLYNDTTFHEEVNIHKMAADMDFLLARCSLAAAPHSSCNGIGRDNMRGTIFALGLLACAGVPALAADLPNRNVVALSFDDGPDPKTTPKLLAILEAKQVKATFCVVGTKVVQFPDIVRRIRDEGHELCNHSLDHPVLGANNVGVQIMTTDLAIKEALGMRVNEPFRINLRAPYGITKHVGACYQGRPFLGWGTDPKDWKSLHRRFPYLSANIAAGAKPGHIIVMHDTRPTTVQIIATVIDRLKDRGMQFATASELWPKTCTQVAAKKGKAVAKKGGMHKKIVHKNGKTKKKV